MTRTPFPLMQPQRLLPRFKKLYGAADAAKCMQRMAMVFGRYGLGMNQIPAPRPWSQHDAFLITYGDMVREEGYRPLQALHRFSRDHLRGALNHIHILPFFPYSSDDGFSVKDFRKVDPELGQWEDLDALGQDFTLMYDLVLNHASREGHWFRDFVAGVAPYRDYFIALEPGTDLSRVTRPRNSPLLSRTQTRQGEQYVWTTFSEDQVDLNYRNPDVLFEIIDTLLYYVLHGARVIRLDAIAYLWKKVGTSCIHQPEVHEIVRLLRHVLDLIAPDVWLLTETNVPHAENISYFGKGQEAHMVYQFSLPPLLLHALRTGNASHLTSWAGELVPPPRGCTFFNFTASHDGIGVRPLEGILPPKELQRLTSDVEALGGYVSTKRNPDGTESPYELNITYFDALGFREGGTDALHAERFLCSQTIALALQGIPAVYFNSLLGARNHREGVAYTGRARTINREKWGRRELETRLRASGRPEHTLFKEYLRRLRQRGSHPSFHPDSPQLIHDLGSTVFAVERVAQHGGERILALHNVSEKEVAVDEGKIRGILDHAPAPWEDALHECTRMPEHKKLRLKPYEACWLVVR